MPNPLPGKPLPQKRRRKRKHHWWKLRFEYAFRPLHVYFALLGIWALVLFTGGGIPYFSKALGLLGIGLLLIWKPPRQNENPWIWVGCLGSILLTLATLVLPRWGGVGPTFLPLVENFDLLVPGTLSIQPRATLEVLALQVALIGTLLVLLNYPLSPGSRKEMMRLLIVGIFLFSLGVVAGNAVGARWIFTEHAQVFSFISNRNQMANLVMIGAVLSFATSWESFGKKGNWAILGVFLTIVLFLALFQLRSRACLFLAFAGILAWIVFKSLRGRRGPYMKVGIPVTLLLFSLFLYFGSESRDRILEQLTAGSSVFSDFRLHVYRDSLAMFLERPWTGFGLGNFEAAFPRFREASFKSESAIHPESDLFWILTESGLVGLALVVILLTGIFQIITPRSSGEKDSTRVLAFMALVLFLVHGLVDVSGHRLATLLVALFLVGLATRRRDRESARLLPHFYPWAWRGAGLVLVLVGVSWLGSPLVSIPTKREHYGELFDQKLRESQQTNRYTDLDSLTRSYAAAFPLDYLSHFKRARALLLQGQSQAAGREFRITRFLNPTSPRFTYWEGEAWLTVNPQWSLDAWRETLNRPRDTQHNYRRRIADHFPRYPEIQEGLLQLSEADTELRFLLLNHLNGPRFVRELERDIDYDPMLSLYGPEDRVALLRKWARFGGGQALLDFIEKNPEVVEDSWELKAVGLANTGQVREAIRSIRSALGQPEIPVEVEVVDVVQLEREFQRSPQDVLKGAILLKKQIQEKRWSQALQTAQTLSRNPNAPPYIYYWAGEIYFMQDDIENSWAFFEEYLDRR